LRLINRLGVPRNAKPDLRARLRQYRLPTIDAAAV
jgi:hypothetical protein